jgi:hypothetical protein
MAFFAQRIDKTCIQRLEHIIQAPFRAHGLQRGDTRSGEGRQEL